MSPRFVRVASKAEIPEGTVKSVLVDDRSIVLCNVGGRLHALCDECTHERFPLSAGFLHDRVLTCALHGARFDVETGEVMGLPATQPVEKYEVKVEGQDVLIVVE